MASRKKAKLKITEHQRVLQRQCVMKKSGKEEGLFAWGFRENARKKQGLRGILEEGCYLGRCCGMGVKNWISGYTRTWATAPAEVCEWRV